MKLKTIYLEGTEHAIKSILEIAKKNLGDGIDVIDINHNPTNVGINKQEVDQNDN